MSKKTKVPTWLPVFTGFYENMWWAENLDTLSEDLREDYGYTGDDLWAYFDYSAWHDAIGKKICGAMEKELKDFVFKIEFEKIKSPRFYNFESDSIYCTITPKKRAIRKFIYDNKDAFAKYVADNYTSRDGFISSHPNDFETWEARTDKFRDLTDQHWLGAILNFISQQLEITEESLYYDVRDDLYESEFISGEFLKVIIKEVEDYAREIYLKPDRLKLMHEKFEGKKFDFESVLRKIDLEISEQTLKMVFDEKR